MYVVSDALRKKLVEDRGISDHRVIRIFNGIELSDFHPLSGKNNLRNQWGVPADAPLVSAVGRMVWEKGFEYLIEAVPQIASSISEARFLIVGEGPLKDK